MATRTKKWTELEQHKQGKISQLSICESPFGLLLIFLERKLEKKAATGRLKIDRWFFHPISMKSPEDAKNKNTIIDN